MKKNKIFILLLIFALLTNVLVIYFTSKNKADKNISNQNKIDSLQDTKIVSKNEADEIEVFNIDGYSIFLKGNARPKNNEICFEDAVKIGIKEYEKQYQTDKNDYTIEIYFLDGILSKTGFWSGHIFLNKKEKYEFLVDGKDGTLSYLIKKT